MFPGKFVADPSIIVTEAPGGGVVIEDFTELTETVTSEAEAAGFERQVPSREIWMDFEQFCRCFKYVLHVRYIWNIILLH